MLILTNPPASEALYTACSVTVNGIPAKTPAARVSAMPYNTSWPGMQRPIDQTELAPVLSFSADEAVTVTVTYETAPAEVLVRPLSKGVTAEVKGSTATITLTTPGAYTVEADGFHNALHIFFDPVKDFGPCAEGMETVLRYGAGVHEIGDVEIFSNTAVILDRNAVIYGSFTAVNAENIAFCGYGVVDGSREKRVSGDDLLPLNYYGRIPTEREEFFSYLKENRVLKGILRFYRCRNIRVEGVTLRDASTFALIPAQCEDMVIDNIKTIGMWRYNADGIDLFNCRRVVIRSCFLRDFDDCIVLKGIAGWDEWDMEHILVENCVTWCDWGRNLEIGAETNAPAYHDILFRNCDCIHGSTVFCDIQHHNRADVFDVTFENIRCEYTKYQLPDTYQHDMNAPFTPATPTRHPYLLAAPILKMGLFAKDVLSGRIHDVTFRNIQILTDAEGLPKPAVQFVGLDAEHTVENVTVDGVWRDGVRLDKDGLEWQTNEFVRDIRFLTEGE